MRRRAFIAVAIGALTWPLSGKAQPVKRARLCFLTFDPGTPQLPAKRFEAFFERLRELGYVDGQTITIDYLHPEGRSDRYPELVAECLRANPDITPGAHALKNATSTIPIVMVALGDPVGTKLVDSLSRPGGNITGIFILEAVPTLVLGVLAFIWLTDRPEHASWLTREQEGWLVAKRRTPASVPRSAHVDLEGAFQQVRADYGIGLCGCGR